MFVHSDFVGALFLFLLLSLSQIPKYIPAGWRGWVGGGGGEGRGGISGERGGGNAFNSWNFSHFAVYFNGKKSSTFHINYVDFSGSITFP